MLRRLLNRLGQRFLYPLAPAHLRLPLRYRLAGLEGGLEPELLHLEALRLRPGVAVDVGANVGFFAYRLAALYPKVYAFEANADLLQDLHDFNPGTVEIRAEGVSSAEGELKLHIPVLNGVPLVGWASLTPGNCPETNEHLIRTVHVRPLDAAGLEGPVGFIKIDVEGHELEVLRGAREILRRDLPVLLVEIREANLAPIRELLFPLGYRETTLQALAGVDGMPGNYLFTPAR